MSLGSTNLTFHANGVDQICRLRMRQRFGHNISNHYFLKGSSSALRESLSAQMALLGCLTRLSLLCLHHYERPASSLKAHLEKYHKLYLSLPVWLTEFADSKDTIDNTKQYFIQALPQLDSTSLELLGSWSVMLD